MPNLTWSAAVEVLREHVEQLKDSWEAVEFRLLLEQGENDRTTTIGAYFEPTIEPLPGDLRIAFESPLLVQGRMSVIQFLALANSWRGGRAYRFGAYEFTPPNVSSVTWDQDIPAGNLFNRLINPLPTTDTEYRFHRLTGGSGSVDTKTRDQLSRVAGSMGTSPYHLLEQYMGMSWDATTNYLTAVLPIPATMLLPRADPANSKLHVCMRYRRPFQAKDFWVRVSAGIWRSSLPTVSLADEGPDIQGWYQACTPVDVSKDNAVLNVWAGRINSTQLYDWHVLHRQETPAAQEPTTRTFLAAWNRLATRRPAALLGDPAKAATGRMAANVGVAAELLVLHGLAGLGYPTFYGPSPFETSGLDIMAFDAASGTAFAISVTVTEAIGDKIGKLMLLRKELEAAVGKEWHLSLAVVTIQPRDGLVAARLKEANDDNVNVLTGEDLQPLMDESPDLRPFEQALHRRRQVYPSAPGL